MLAVQNMEASGAITKRFEIEFNALEGSLSMMSKGKMLPYSVAPHPPNQWMTVLNDVLDLYVLTFTDSITPDRLSDTRFAAIGWIAASSSPRFDLTLYIKSCGLYLSLCNSRRMRVTCNSRLVWIRESIRCGLFLFDVRV